MQKNAFFLSILLMITILHYTPTTEAQILPDVDITCTPVAMELDVSAKTEQSVITDCRAENPSLFVEEVDIQIQSGDLAYIAPGTITVNGLGTTDFWIDFRGYTDMPADNRTVTISYIVKTANGLQCFTCTSKQFDVQVMIYDSSIVTNATNDTSQSMWSCSTISEYFFFIGGYIIFPIILLTILGVAYASKKRNDGAVGRA